MYTRPNIGWVLITALTLAALWSGPAAAESPQPLNPQSILQQAVQATDEIGNNSSKSDMLVKVAGTYFALGFQTEARAVLSRALTTTKTMDDANRMRALAEIAGAQAGMGDIGESRSTLWEALQIQDSSRHPEIAAVLGTLASTGDVEGALTVAKTIEDGQTKFWAFRFIAITLARSGQYAAALQAADLTDAKYTKTYVTLVVATEQLWVGREQDARMTAVAIEHEPLYIAFLARLAEEQGKAEDRAAASKTIEEALKAASLIKSNKEHGEWDHDIFALKEIAAAQTRIGDLAGALKTANLVRVQNNKYFPLFRIAEVQVGMGNFKGALETADVASATGNVDSIIFEFGQAQVRDGDIPGAMKTAGSIQGFNQYKNAILDDVAVAQAKSGDWASATATFDQARIHDVWPMAFHPGGLTEMTEAQAARGKVEEAYQWAMSQKTPDARVQALIGVAKGMQKNK